MQDVEVLQARDHTYSMLSVWKTSTTQDIGTFLQRHRYLLQVNFKVYYKIANAFQQEISRNPGKHLTAPFFYHILKPI